MQSTEIFLIQYNMFFSKWALNNYGEDVDDESPWMRMVNSDFSSFFKMFGHINPGKISTS